MIPAMPPAPRRWFMSWLALAILAVVLVGGLAVLWMGGRGDLEAVEARGRAMGVPPTWTEAGAVLSPKPVRDAWSRLHQLATSLHSYQDTHSGQGNQARPGMPLSPELRKHHAVLDAVRLAELDALCAGLPGDGVSTLVESDFLTALPLVQAGRELTRLMAERTALATPDQVVALARLHLAAITAEQPRTLIQVLVANSRLAYWQQAASCRLGDAELDRAALADAAAQARAWLDAAMDAAWCGEYRFVRTTALAIAAGDPRYATGLLPEFGFPAWLDGHGLHRPLMRLARRSVLEADLDMIAAWRSSTTPAARLAAMHALTSRLTTAPAWDLRARVAMTLVPAGELVCTSWAKTDVGLRVLEAELRGTPWPLDPTDPAGGMVHRVERGGRLIGYYLLGRNGGDDGGVPGRDDCVSLYEPLGSPKAADPVPPPAP